MLRTNAGLAAMARSRKAGAPISCVRPDPAAAPRRPERVSDKPHYGKCPWTGTMDTLDAYLISGSRLTSRLCLP